MQYLIFFSSLLLLLFFSSCLVLCYDGPLYDSSAYTQCKLHPEEPLYNGGILKDQVPSFLRSIMDNGDQVSYPTFLLQNLTVGNRYCFSESMKNHLFILFLGFSLRMGSPLAAYDGPIYDYTAYTKCKLLPEDPLYKGGIIKNQAQQIHNNTSLSRTALKSPAFVLYNLSGNTIYSFSSWVTINGADSAVIKARVTTDNNTFNCMGTVNAKLGCWSFLKGGFVMNSPASHALIYFQNVDGGQISITISSPSLQPFTDQQWRINQEQIINTERKRMAILHVADVDGNRLQGATVVVEQVSRDFPFGSAIAQTILGNLPYQKWFIERFNAAVFEDELKWYSTEPRPGVVNYTIPDQMLEFVRRNQIIARGHNIFWENPNFTPSWVRNLTGPELQTAVKFRIQSLMNQYKNEFIHWDVDNEMLHYNFYEQRLGPNASLQFFETAQKSDPLARLFMNEFNVLETCDDQNATVDAYISRLGELGKGGVSMDGIGLEGHFNVPNPPLIRAVLDKLAILELPIWLTEIDISKTLDHETQARYLEAVLREGFSHPS
ncbi:anti-sigma-I factor 6 [Olea europaea subsp. europaea]|uniref:Anti-sigma-I factor 6 n=1 Tax=Olea europaea subsp. europaea TaxID=158383 RepID=A0A8S0T0Q8_OLEEU|nr:anti-sigma-I factor 6 [Olea europaea subsp. europaea]